MERQIEDRDGGTLRRELTPVWDGDPELRREFLDSFDSFVAYTRAVRGGHVKIIGGKVKS